MAVLPLAAEREQVLDGLDGAERGHLDGFDIGAQVANGLLVPLDLPELGENDVRQRDQRSEGVVEIVRDAAREHAQRLHSLRRGRSFLHAAFMQHARLHQLLA